MADHGEMVIWISLHWSALGVSCSLLKLVYVVYQRLHASATWSLTHLGKKENEKLKYRGLPAQALCQRVLTSKERKKITKGKKASWVEIKLSRLTWEWAKV